PGELGLEGHRRPSEVGGGENRAGEVDDAGRADAHTEDGARREADELPDEVDDLRGGLGAGRAGERDLSALDDGPVEVEEGAAEQRVVAQVDSDDLEGRPIDVEEGGRFAGAGLVALAGLDDEAFGDELADEIGDGDSGEARAARDVGAAL